MYHDTIHINFRYNQNDRDITFDYNFYISKHQQDKFSPIAYGELLKKFEDIGFNTKYITFKDIDDDNTLVYCTYNWQPNFNIFFSAYKKLMIMKEFDISFGYGVIINGKYSPNNMNNFAEIRFTTIEHKGWKEEVIKGKNHYKYLEFYQLVDKEGIVIHAEMTNSEMNFEQHFFENYKVQVAMRKYKLNRLKLQFSD